MSLRALVAVRDPEPAAGGGQAATLRGRAPASLRVASEGELWSAEGPEDWPRRFPAAGQAPSEASASGKGARGVATSPQKAEG